jgi:hypothetical protein
LEVVLWFLAKLALLSKSALSIKIFEFCNLGSLRSGKNSAFKILYAGRDAAKGMTGNVWPSASLKPVILFLGEKSAEDDTKSEIWQKFCFFFIKRVVKFPLKIVFYGPKNCFLWGGVLP